MDYVFWIPFIAIALVVLFGPKSRDKKAVADTKTLEEVIDTYRNRITVVTTPTVPGKEIKHVHGAITGNATTQASSNAQTNLAEKEALLDLLKKADLLGANAIVDLKLASTSHEQQGSKWMVSKIFYSGTALSV